jgi:hypothetical protein
LSSSDFSTDNSSSTNNIAGTDSGSGKRLSPDIQCDIAKILSLPFSIKKRPRQELPATTWLGGNRIIDIELFGKSYPVPYSHIVR